jgi:catechol 2,3-dioxygenase-like lactoylglutathione lyase family enzyme
VLGKARLLANLRTADLDRTVAFYEGTLGLPVIVRREVMPGHEEVRFDAGGGLLCFEVGTVRETTNALVSWDVEDIDTAVAQLRERGVEFEEYDYPSLKTVDGIARVGNLSAAWFKDPDGNLLAVLSG